MVAAGSAAITITVTGSNFTASTIVQVSGVAASTTFVSTSQLTAVVPASQLSTSGQLSVSVSGGTGTASTVGLEVENPLPAVASFAPSAVTLGSPTSTINLTGTNFVSGSVVQINGSARTTTYISSTQLSFQLTAADQATAGALSIAVSNPTPGGGTSSAAVLAVNNPMPSLVSIAPASALVGSPATTATLTGTHFISTSVVQVNGSARATAYVSATQLTFQLTAADLLSTSDLTVMVVNPLPGGGSSAAISIALNDPVPVLQTLSPTYAIVGTKTPQTIIATGSGFLPTSTVHVGNQEYQTTYISATQLSFQLSAADQASATKLSVTVTNPAPGGGTSSAQIITVTLSTAPTITVVSPAQLLTGSPDTKISVFGSLLTATTQVEWNGTPLSTTPVYLGSVLSYLTATVPANLLTSAMVANLTLYNATATPTTSVTYPIPIADPPAPTITSLSSTAGPIGNAVQIIVSGTNFTLNSTLTVNGNLVPTTVSSTTSLVGDLPASVMATPGNYNFG